MTYSKLLSLGAAFAITAMGLVAVATPASAKQGKPVIVSARVSDLPTRRVSYADLNLATLDGEKTLNRRVAGAVRSVCEESTGPLPGFYANSRCRRFAWSGAKPQIARAIERSRQIAATGTSNIAAVAITIAIPQ